MLINYNEVDKKEAKIILDNFLAENNKRLEEFRAQIDSSEHARHLTLDYSRRSLDQLSKWAEPRWQQRPNGPQINSPESSRHKTYEEVNAIIGQEVLPNWVDYQFSIACYVSTDNVWLIDGLARYLAECLFVALPKARWSIGHDSHKGYHLENKIVISNLPSIEFSPMEAIAGVAAHVLNDDHQPYSMTKIYDRIANLNG